ncbi:MAG: glutamine-hydrolyzing carbamoyl-phosphate synthase small subunit [Elusimicrobia bacterium]|nr:glutamine-hydrolyzing carbamoyl-phosphate synthase small subunit [Elusimicrobiota bacterium]
MARYADALLTLEDGTVFRGRSCGALLETAGEVVFNTSMTGYQEILTDPSYKGQIVCMTYPHIGNYGITREDSESARPWVEGLVVRELCRTPSNWQSTEALDVFLRRNGIPAIEGIDTRALTRLLRTRGSLRAVLSPLDSSVPRLLAKARALPSMTGRDLARVVTCRRPYAWTETLPAGIFSLPPQAASDREAPPHVAVLDFGVKYGILRCLASAGCRVTVLPAAATAEDVLSLSPDGILLSNGPGDPEPVQYAVQTVRRLLETRVPMFGICLGHQLLGLALGAKTYKLKFGHHGANHPVRDLETGKVEITAQNHNFCIDPASLPPQARLSHINLNDQTCEGFSHAQLPVFSVQYHPEASAGPHDSRHLLSRFLRLMDEHSGKITGPHAQAR